MIIWDKKKNDWLKKNRGVDFESAELIILSERYLDILKNPVRNNQCIFIICLDEYTYVVPFVFDEEGNLILKTIYPSRKFHKRYKRKG